MNTYTARAERDESGWWVVTVPEPDGVFTQSRTLDRVEDLTRDAIALWLEVPSTSFNVEVKAVVSELDERIAEVDHLRREAERLREAAGAGVAGSLVSSPREVSPCETSVRCWASRISGRRSSSTNRSRSCVRRR